MMKKAPINMTPNQNEEISNQEETRRKLLLRKTLSRIFAILGFVTVLLIIGGGGRCWQAMRGIHAGIRLNNIKIRD